MNARITKEKAKQVAAKLLEKKLAEVAEAENKIKFFITDIAKKNVPRLAYELLEKHKEYSKTIQYKYLKGEGIQRWQECSLLEKIPNNESPLELTKVQADKYIQLQRKHTDLKLKYNTLLVDVETALIKCGTYKKVQELFPEAAPYLPTVYAPPALNITDIRNRIK